MDFYFVDYENVNTAGLNGLPKLTEEDMVIIFYSEKADKLTFGLHRRLKECRAALRYQRVMAGTKNALDFQLSSYLGYLICENAGKDCRFFIVSLDQGYAVLSTYWKRQNVDVRLVRDIAMRHGQDGGGGGAYERPEPGTKGGQEPSKQTADAEVDWTEVERRLADLLPDKGRAGYLAKLIRESATRQDAYLKMWQELNPDPNDRAVFEIFRAVQPALIGKPSHLERALEAMIPDKSRVPAVAKIIRSCPTKKDVRYALTQEYHLGSGVQTASEIYLLILPLIAAKPDSSSREEAPPADSPPPDGQLEQQLEELLPDKSRVPTVARILRTFRSKQEISGELNRAFRPGPGDRSVSEIYQAIQPLIADRPGAAEERKSPNTSLENELRDLLPDRNLVPAVAAIIRRCTTKTAVNAALMKAYPSPNNQTAGELYRTIKPLLSGKK